MAQTVDEERRRPVHAASNAAQEVLVDPIGVDVLGEPLAAAAISTLRSPCFRIPGRVVLNQV